MLGNRALLSICVLVSFLAGKSQATCINKENTSIPESTPTKNYSIRPDGTLEAPDTGLMWKRCLEGQEFTDGVCEGTPTVYTWAEALRAAEAVSFAGHNDWRLPNPKELLSIFEDRCLGPSLNADLFPISIEFGAWTATPTATLRLDLYDDVWFFSSGGGLSRTVKYQLIPILLVRDLP